MTKQVVSSIQLSDLAIQGIQELKGVDLLRMDLRNLETAVTDFFVIATGTSDRHVAALGDSVLKMMKEEAEENPISKEGFQKGDWVLLDYGSVVVHIFLKKVRDFYRLEDFWGDAEFEKFSEERVS
jgi:ribosome-associated protein